MKKSLLPLILSSLLSASGALAQITLSFNDNSGTPNAGTYMPGATFSFDITLSVASNIPNGIAGYSLWFETAAANSDLFVIPTIPNYSGSPFDSPTPFSSDFPQPLTSSGSQHMGFAENQVDLGAIAGVNQPTPGSYFLQNISFTISNAIAPGTYTIMSTSAETGHPAGRRSIVDDGSGNTFDISPSTYTITVIPEPATWTLLTLGALVCTGSSVLRRRRPN